MKIFAEHPSILAIFCASGIVVDEQQGPVLLAWSDAQSLELKPIAAVLRIPGARLIQLPLSLSELKTAFSHKHSDIRFDAEPIELYTPLGQLKWSLSEFKSDLSQGNSTVAERRLVEIQMFCDENWLGWFNQALVYLHHSRGLAFNEATFVINGVSEYASSVAFLDKFRPFLHGAPKDIVNSALGACSALMRYAITGSGGIDQDSLLLIRDMLNADDWWRDLTFSLDDIADKLVKSGANGEVFDDVLDQVCIVKSSASMLVEFLEKLACGNNPTAIEIAPAYEAIDGLMQLIIQVESRSAAIKSEFEERFNNA